MDLPVNVAMSNYSAPGLDHQPMLEWKRFCDILLGKNHPISAGTLWGDVQMGN